MLRHCPILPLLLHRQRQCFFHSTPISFAQDNLYSILQVPQNATPSEVKKSFYNLSKTHHPDHNPSDSTASQRFVKISEAYAVLSIPAKRREYDHTLSITSTFTAPRPRGSYHSSSPAGGRPASGLSNRRTPFRGPPPSFYRSGGWGAHEEKRRAAQSQSAPEEEAPKTYTYTNGGERGYYGGMGLGQNPFGAENDVRHFDRDAHYRRQESQEQRRERRRQRTRGEAVVGDRGRLMDMVIVGGALGLVIILPPFLFSDGAVVMDGKERGKAQKA